MLTTETESEPATRAGEVTPILIFDVLRRHQQTKALKSALDLEIFTHIADGAVTSSEIGARCRASERGVRILCDFLAVLGFLTKTNGHYGLPSGAGMFLDKESPRYIGSIANFIASDASLAPFRDLTAVVRNGGTLDAEGSLSPENDLWVTFAHSMAPIAQMAAQALAPLVTEPGRKTKVLDFSSGHGAFGITLARYNAAAAVFAVDWRSVLAVAMENAKRAGVESRFHPLPGNVFDVDLGAGYDLILLPNFLHHFDPPTIHKLLRKLRAALNPNGRVATLEFVPNEDRITPAIPASFSLTMLAFTQGGDAYTFREFDEMFRKAGFGKSTIQDLPPTPQSLVLTAA